MLAGCCLESWPLPKGVSHPPMPNKNCLDYYDMVPIDDYDDDNSYHINRQFTAKNLVKLMEWGYSLSVLKKNY